MKIISFIYLLLFFTSLTTTTTTPSPLKPQEQSEYMRLMLRDAEAELRDHGFSLLSRWIETNQAELVGLDTITVFGLDDASISSGSFAYLSIVKYHIVPNQYLTMADLERLPVNKTLPTLERGPSLVVTASGAALRINGVKVKDPDVIRNLNIVVHSVYLAFPRVHPKSAVIKGGDKK